MTNIAPHRVVVIGGGYTGLTAAARICENTADVSLTLIDAKSEFVERIRLHEIAGGSTPRHLPYNDCMATRWGRFVQAKVLRIEPDQRRVLVGPVKDGQDLAENTTP